MTAYQIRDFMGVSSATAYRRIKKLYDAGYLKRNRVLHNQSRIYWPSSKSILSIQDELKRIKNISLGTFHHDKTLVDLALSLEFKTNGNYIPERRIRQERANQTGRVPDGCLRLLNDQKIAIELELSMKSQARIQKIIKSYMTNFDYNEVWYFTNKPSVERALQKHTPKNSHIKINPIRIEESIYER